MPSLSATMVIAAHLEGVLMAVLEHQSDSLLPCLFVPSLGYDLSFPQKEVWIMPGVVQLGELIILISDFTIHPPSTYHF